MWLYSLFEVMEYLTFNSVYILCIISLHSFVGFGHCPHTVSYIFSPIPNKIRSVYSASCIFFIIISWVSRPVHVHCNLCCLFTLQGHEYVTQYAHSVCATLCIYSVSLIKLQEQRLVSFGLRLCCATPVQPT